MAWQNHQTQSRTLSLSQCHRVLAYYLIVSQCGSSFVELGVVNTKWKLGAEHVGEYWNKYTGGNRCPFFMKSCSTLLWRWSSGKHNRLFFRKRHWLMGSLIHNLISLGRRCLLHPACGYLCLVAGLQWLLIDILSPCGVRTRYLRWGRWKL